MQIVKDIKSQSETAIGDSKAATAEILERLRQELTKGQDSLDLRNMDYVRKCISAIPYTGRILSLDAPAPGYDPADDVTYGEIILDEYSKTLEQIFIKEETLEEVRNALQMISDRERAYLPAK